MRRDAERLARAERDLTAARAAQVQVQVTVDRPVAEMAPETMAALEALAQAAMGQAVANNPGMKPGNGVIPPSRTLRSRTAITTGLLMRLWKRRSKGK